MRAPLRRLISAGTVVVAFSLPVASHLADIKHSAHLVDGSTGRVPLSSPLLGRCKPD